MNIITSIVKVAPTSIIMSTNITIITRKVALRNS